MPTNPHHRAGTDRLERLHHQLLDAITALETGEQWQAWLTFATGFHNYSFNNIILIHTQLPTASLVTGYRTWQAKNRQVRKGERALHVLAPMLRTEPVLDYHGHPVLDPDGKPRTTRRRVGYRPVPVFDISQTDGPPLPEPVRPQLLSGQAPPGLWDALASEAMQRGYRLLRGTAADLDGANGRTCFDTREIWVRHDVDDAQAVKTLAHELGHVLLHTVPGPGDPVPAETAHGEPTPAQVSGMLPCQGVREVEAESVAYLVTTSHGMSTDAYTFPYVTTWAHAVATDENVPLTTIVERTGSRVMHAALVLIDATTDPDRPDPVTPALTMRVEQAAERSADLREQTSSLAARTTTRLELDVLHAVLADSQAYFQRAVSQSWVPGYLEQRRLDGAVDSHGLGCAPAGWTSLVEHLARLGYRDDHIEAAGMATRSRRGTLIDRFRDRLTIPVRDEHGAVIGFVGRLGPSQIEDQYHPRYFNTPNTPLYVKGDTLLGLDRAATRPDCTPVLCEGPLDAVAIDIAAQQTGRPYVGVATAGTAFTARQAQALTTVAGDRMICLAFDPDQPGQRAAQSAWLALTDAGPRRTTLATLSAGEDPADLVAHDRTSELIAAIDAAAPAAQAISDRRIDESGVEDHCVRRLAAFRTLLDYLDRIPADEQTPFVDHLAQRLQIDHDAAVETLATRNGSADSAPSPTVTGTTQSATSVMDDPRATLHEHRAQLTRH